MKNIALIGMMGSGKSTIGKAFIKEFNSYTFVDTDEEIVKKSKQSINDIFSKEGESYFRKLETDTLKNILKKDNLIISTGGGIVLKEDNQIMLKEHCIVIYLKAEETTLFERLKNDNERPLLKVDDIRNKINKLLKERNILYNNCCHYSVNTDNKSIEEVIEEIGNIIKQNG